MLRGFITYLDDYLTEVGLIGLVRAALGILVFASVLSALFGSTAFKAAALVIGVLCTLGLLTVLITTSTSLNHRVDRYQSLLTYYCDLIYGQSDHLWRIDRWEEDIRIRQNGDTTGSILVHAMVESDELLFCRIRFGPNWSQPDRFRRRVRVTASSVEVDGTGGCRWDRTLNWLPDGRLEVLAHFRSAPPKKGDEVTLRVEFAWPGKAAPLMRFGRPDDFMLQMGRPLAYLSYRVELPSGAQVKCDAVGLKREADRFTLSSTTTTDKHPVIHLIAHDIAADRRVGMRLDLK
jgi:hypothetical protein